MKQLLVLVLAGIVACTACTEPVLPPVRRSMIDRAANAREQARTIAGQKCRYDGHQVFRVTGWDAQRFHCERGSFVLELDRFHLFEEKFFSLKPDDAVVFRYSETILLKPQYLEYPQPHDKHPAYYLEPIP
jgi:hypothetical protein